MPLVLNGQALLVVSLGRYLEDDGGGRPAVRVIDLDRLRPGRRIERNSDHRHAPPVAQQKRRAVTVDRHAGLARLGRTQVQERDATGYAALERQ